MKKKDINDLRREILALGNKKVSMYDFEGYGNLISSYLTRLATKGELKDAVKMRTKSGSGRANLYTSVPGAIKAALAPKTKEKFEKPPMAQIWGSTYPFMFELPKLEGTARVHRRPM